MLPECRCAHLLGGVEGIFRLVHISEAVPERGEEVRDRRTELSEGALASVAE